MDNRPPLSLVGRGAGGEGKRTDSGPANDASATAAAGNSLPPLPFVPLIAGYVGRDHGLGNFVGCLLGRAGLLVRGAGRRLQLPRGPVVLQLSSRHHPPSRLGAQHPRRLDRLSQLQQSGPLRLAVCSAAGYRRYCWRRHWRPHSHRHDDLCPHSHDHDSHHWYQTPHWYQARAPRRS